MKGTPMNPQNHIGKLIILLCLALAWTFGVIAASFYMAAPVNAADQPAADPKQATKDAPWVNSLGMKFVPVAGTSAQLPGNKDVLHSAP